MNKTIKFIASGIIISIALFIVSCIDKVEVPTRTKETEQIEIDKAIASLEAEGFNVDTTELGVYYIMQKEGPGPLPQKSDTCSLIYDGYFLSGAIFDSSSWYYQDSIWQFRYLENSIVPGFNDGISLLNKDAEADIIVPSRLAYGSLGYGTISPFTPLFFSIKMRDLKPVIEEETEE